MAADASKVLNRVERLKGDQGNWTSLWQEISQYISPRRSTYLLGRTQGTRQTDVLFDSTAPHCMELLASSLSSVLIPENMRWFTPVLFGVDTSEDPDLTGWFENCGARMLFAFRQGGMYPEIQEAFLDQSAFGISATYATEARQEVPGFNGLYLHSLPVGSYWVAEGPNGKIDTLFRERSESARNILDEFKANAGPKVIEDAEKNPDKTYTVVEGVYPRNFAEIQRKGSSGYPIAAVSILKDQKLVMSESGYFEFPYMVPRWSTASGEAYGRGPGTIALPTVKTLNKAVELSLRASEKSIDPPLEILEDGIVGKVKTYPSAINYSRQMGNIRAIDLKARFDVIKLEIQDMRIDVRKVFYTDQLQLAESPQMTAAEVYVRYELMQRLIGPTMGRLSSELLSPLIKRCFFVMLRAGCFLPPPASLQFYSRGHFDVEYESPMARAQRSGDLTSLQRYVSTMAPFVSIDPGVFDWLNLDEVSPGVARLVGLPVRFGRSPGQVKAIRDNRMQQQMAQAKMQNLAMIAEGAGKAAPAIKALTEGSK